MAAISFVVPAYNEQASIGACITSIREALYLNNVIGEIIVVDNGSTDNTAQIARAHGAIVVSEPAKGTNHARAAGHIAARYALVAHVDADNVVPAGWIEAVLDTMNDPCVVACSGPLYYDMAASKRLVAEVFYVLAHLTHQALPMLQGGNFVMRRLTYDVIGGFDTSITFYGDDTDTAVRLAKVGKIKFVPTMWIYSSPRRIQAEGLFATGVRYIGNYFAVHILGRPWSESHNDIRT